MSGTPSAGAVDAGAGVYPVALPRLLLLALLPAGLVVFVGPSAWSSFRQGHLLAGALYAAALCPLLVWLAFLISWRQTITADAVEIRSIFGVNRLARSDIAGRRDITPSSRVSTLALLLVARGGRTMRVPVTGDVPYGTWLNDLPQLDLTAGQFEEQRLQDNPAFGVTADARRARIGLIRTLYSIVVLACFVFWPVAALWRDAPPFLTFLVAAAPLLAIAAALGLGGIRSTTTAGEAVRLDIRSLVRPSLLLIAVGVVMTIRLLHYRYLEAPLLAPCAIVLGLVLFGMTAWLDKVLVEGSSVVLAGLLLLCSCGYGAGVLAEINDAFDASPGLSFQSRIIARQVSHGRRGDSYNVTLAPWGGRADPEEIPVSSAQYDRLQEFDFMCVTQHPGALGFVWFVQRPCEIRPGQPPRLYRP